MKFECYFSRVRGIKTILGIAAFLFFGVTSLSAQGEQIFKGQICLGPEGRTPTIENGQARLPCTVAHPKRNARYILFNPADKTTYYVESHSKAKPFAGRDVVVIGTLDSATGFHFTSMNCSAHCRRRLRRLPLFTSTAMPAPGEWRQRGGPPLRN